MKQFRYCLRLFRIAWSAPTLPFILAAIDRKSGGTHRHALHSTSVAAGELCGRGLSDPVGAYYSSKIWRGTSLCFPLHYTYGGLRGRGLSDQVGAHYSSKIWRGTSLCSPDLGLARSGPILAAIDRKSGGARRCASWDNLQCRASVKSNR